MSAPLEAAARARPRPPWTLSWRPVQVGWARFKRVRTKDEHVLAGLLRARNEAENEVRAHLHNSERNGQREFNGKRLERLLNGLLNASILGIADR